MVKTLINKSTLIDEFEYKKFKMTISGNILNQKIVIDDSFSRLPLI